VCTYLILVRNYNPHSSPTCYVCHSSLWCALHIQAKKVDPFDLSLYHSDVVVHSERINTEWRQLASALSPLELLAFFMHSTSLRIYLIQNKTIMQIWSLHKFWIWYRISYNIPNHMLQNIVRSMIHTDTTSPFTTAAHPKPALCPYPSKHGFYLGDILRKCVLHFLFLVVPFICLFIHFPQLICLHWVELMVTKVFRKCSVKDAVPS